MKLNRTSNRSCIGCVFGAIVIVLCAGGCETISQDLNYLSKTLMPVSPREAAEMMVDPHNADRRREGTVLISNAHFGGSAEYLRFYRAAAERDDDPTVRAVAVRALGRHGEPSDAPLVALQLQHENEQVRWEAAKSLQRLHNLEAVNALLTAVRNEAESPNVRVAAAHALGQYPQDRVFQALIAALDDRHLSLNLTAEQSLQTLTGQSLGLDARQWTRWYNNEQPDQRFADRSDYLYPTYSRELTLLERMVFWTTQRFEQPGVPAGMQPPSQRRTYENEDAAPVAQ